MKDITNSPRPPFTVTEESISNLDGELSETTMYFERGGGKKIFGVEIIPLSRAEGERLPAVILSHGFGGRYYDELEKARMFAKAGYACFCFDFGGINKESKTEGLTEDTTLDSEKEELQEVVDFVLSRGYCDEKKLYLYGESMGGFITTLVAASAPSRFKAVTLIYPALSIPTDYSNGLGLAPWQKFKDNALSYYGKEKDLFLSCAMPVLIQHGTDDKLVDISFSRNAAKIFPNAKLIELPGAGHGINMPWESVIKTSIEFFNGR